MAQELRRKSIHLLGLAVPITYAFIPYSTALLIVGILAGIALLIELLKVLFPPFLNWFVQTFSLVLRARERKGGFTGTTYYFIASFLCIAITANMTINAVDPYILKSLSVSHGNL